MTIDWKRAIRSVPSGYPAIASSAFGRRFVVIDCGGKISAMAVDDEGRTVWPEYVNVSGVGCDNRPSGHLVVENVPTTVETRLARIEARLGL